jgi:hypothetical protein
MFLLEALQVGWTWRGLVIVRVLYDVGILSYPAACEPVCGPNVLLTQKLQSFFTFLSGYSRDWLILVRYRCEDCEATHSMAGIGHGSNQNKSVDPSLLLRRKVCESPIL